MAGPLPKQINIPVFYPKQGHFIVLPAANIVTLG